MEKVKNAFAKVATWIKKHWIIAVVVLAVVLVAVVAVNFILGAEKRAVKKYISAVNSYDVDKIAKAMDIKANRAWSTANSSSYSWLTDEDSSDGSSDVVEKFEDALDEVDDDDVDNYKDQLDDQYDKDDKGQTKVKLLKVIYSTKAKDNKDLKKVVCKVRITTKPDKDDDDDEEESIWSKEKDYTRVVDTYVTFYLYKNKVINSGI